MAFSKETSNRLRFLVTMLITIVLFITAFFVSLTIRQTGSSTPHYDFQNLQ